MVVDNEPEESESTRTTGPLLEFHVDRITLYSSGATKGLSTITNAEIRSANGDVIWRRQFIYSQNPGRAGDLEELEADNGKLLKEEMNFAAEATVKDFINHLKTGSSP